MPRIRADRSGQALVEYTLLLGVFLLVWAALSYFVSEDYHEKAFDAHAELLVEALEAKVFSECVESKSCEE